MNQSRKYAMQCALCAVIFSLATAAYGGKITWRKVAGTDIRKPLRSFESEVRQVGRDIDRQRIAALEEPLKQASWAAFESYKQHVEQKNSGKPARTLPADSDHYRVLAGLLGSQVDLNRVRFVFDAYVPGDMAAVTFSYTVYVRSSYSAVDDDLTVLLGHELMHVVQYQELGGEKHFAYRYFGYAGASVRDRLLRGDASASDVETIHDDIALEREAIAFEAEVSEAIARLRQGLDLLAPLPQAPPRAHRFFENEKWANEFWGDIGTFFADVNGDGCHDAIVVNRGSGIFVRLSTGIAFSGTDRWSNEFYGNEGTFFADVNGDGKADAIAVNRNGTHVKLSTGGQFVDSPDQWSKDFYGNKRTFLADVNGDGKADAVAVNHNGTFVKLSTGGQFTDSTDQWSADFFGDLETFVDDVSGDGKADAIAVNRTGTFVKLSTGGQFVDPPAGSQWSRDFYGDYGVFCADVDGDGVHDNIAVNSRSGLFVKRSLGRQLEDSSSNWGTEFFGNRGTYFADVDGDGASDAIVVNSGENGGITVRRAVE